MDEKKARSRKLDRYFRLSNCTTRSELASLLNISSVFLTNVIYIQKPDNLYRSFNIPKKSGGHRVIFAPAPQLKEIQSSLAHLLLDCIDAINIKKGENLKLGKPFISTLSHGFSRKKSIITNAEKHRNRRVILNTDIEDFFGSFNFGRVRGFFLKNRNFQLFPDIATTIAQIACYNNALPQGSPSSPVISNLICHTMDIRLAKLASKHSLYYTRYADDLTFSTNKKEIPVEIAINKGGQYEVGIALKKEIHRSGLSINHGKTRVNFKDSRQDVTGLTVNKKINTNRHYWRLERSRCHYLFMTGDIPDDGGSYDLESKISRLHGRLNFIDTIDRHNRVNLAKIEQHIISNKSINGILKEDIEEVLLGKDNNKKTKRNKKLNSREINFSRFLFYRNFYNNSKPLIICEGKTDNIYISCALESLSPSYPGLIEHDKKEKKYKKLIKLYEHTKRARYLLDIHGGADHLLDFIRQYEKRFSYYKAPISNSPVILLLDNDTGPKAIIQYLKNTLLKGTGIDPKNEEFIHICKNLYLVLTPLSNKKDTSMEDFFENTVLKTKVNGKSFNPSNDAATDTTYGKHIFSTEVVKKHKNSISFDMFRPIFDRIVAVIEHYESIKNSL
ncbi:RNA-directed DNA polymerase [Marinobacterium halophilum]|uniref:RNA-directed DNA polymerase n=1 Tax=Marinobacterium halophilum TaxID=267374 RepID=A0A2P8EI96_9GAMM|nr:retron Ec67 family RNA-directed DNA polymerase/endonuclease [Marinobacterium halophilum]PSL09189.1 RNA-directed DNA polymerase [Marinobacterium halophilum]